MAQRFLPLIVLFLFLGGFLALNNPTADDLTRYILRDDIQAYTAHAGEDGAGWEGLGLMHGAELAARQTNRINLGVGSLFLVPNQGKQAIVLGMGRRFFVLRYTEHGHGLRSG